ncbi:hypothetical protein PHPALM_28470 [Phytophthora palmivora]|uniref:Uncharacterized protein n=1 Tax=Phytophthora palmivora TaxID=4796 RepID=A0A2P4X9Z6_9STRA|nr:hypothetical protein PHPALM_28470 [Phytophthora palmivora]
MVIYITRLVLLVEARICEMIPEHYGIMFDGWSDGITHYIGVITTFMGNGVYREVLLGCSPPLNEKQYTAAERYALLEPAALDDIDNVQRADSERIRSIMPTLADFRSVMTDLQKTRQHIGDVHGIFQGLTEDYPELKDYITADANISHSPLFESAVVKILDGKKESLTSEERALVKRFVIS